MDDDIELVRAAYAAFARGDIDAAVADLADDVDWVEPDEIPDGGRHDGRQAVWRYLRASRDRWAELVSEPAVSREGDLVVAEHHVHGTLVDGTPNEFVISDVYTVVGGVVVAMHAHVGPHRP